MKDGFTNVTDQEMHALRESGASGVQILAYMQVARFYNDPEHPSWCSVSAKTASERVGMSQDMFRRALAALTTKTFTTPDGRKVPVLERVSRGHNGRPATYENNINKYLVIGE